MRSAKIFRRIIYENRHSDIRDAAPAAKAVNRLLIDFPARGHARWRIIANFGQNSQPWRCFRSRADTASTERSPRRGPRTRRCRFSAPCCSRPSGSWCATCPTSSTWCSSSSYSRRSAWRSNGSGRTPTHSARRTSTRTTCEAPISAAAPAGCAARSCLSARCWPASGWVTCLNPAGTRSDAAGSTPTSWAFGGWGPSSTSTRARSFSPCGPNASRGATCCSTKPP